MATGDDYAKVSLFKYPSIKPNSAFIDKRAHSSHVTNVKFSADDQNLYSTGGEDQCVIQWNLKKKKWFSEIFWLIFFLHFFFIKTIAIKH